MIFSDGVHVEPGKTVNIDDDDLEETEDNGTDKLVSLLQNERVVKLETLVS